MKKVLLMTLIGGFVSTAVHAQDSKLKESLTYEASYNGKKHTVAVDDTVHLGYGSNPYGSFMYIYNGAPPEPLEKQFAGKDGVVFKVKYIKSLSQYQIYIKGKFGRYIVELPQAIEKGEIAGFNSTYFK